MTGEQKAASKGPLEGLRVLDLGLMGAGPIGPSLLADWGAEVIKVELPEVGNILRRIPPLYNGHSLWFPIEGRHKKSIAVDLHTEAGQRLIKELVKYYDVVVENYRPGTIERWNLGYEELKKAKEDVILVRVTGFGQEGPYKNRTSYDTIGAAMGGMHYLTGRPQDPPALVGLAMCDYFSAAFNALACLIAVYCRHRTGQGQWGEVAQYEAIFRLVEWTVAAYDKLGLVRERSGNRHPSLSPGDMYSTKDGKWLVVMAGEHESFKRLCKAMDRKELISDSRFHTVSKRVENREEIEGIVASWIRERELSEVTEILVKAGVPASPVYSTREIMNDPHIKARENILEVEDRKLGKVKLPNIIPKFSATPSTVRDTGRDLGADDDTILELLKHSPSIPRPAQATTHHAERRPLEGLRIIELGSSLAGSFATVLLADFGAEVIKVEEPGGGDILRQLPPFYDGCSLWWAVEARGKKSITLALGREDGRGILRRLVKLSDVVVEGFLPGTLEGWNLSYEELKGINPGLILLRLSGFGQTGPYKDRASCDPVASAVGGLTFLSGFPDEPPVKPGYALADYLAGTFGALGIMAALYHRDRSGEGQWIDLALYEPLIRFSHQNIPTFDKLGEVKERVGNRSHPRGLGVGPAGLFETRDSKWIAILSPEDKDWGRLCRAMGQEALALHPKFSTLLKRSQNLEEANGIIANWARGFTAEAIRESLNREQVPFSLVYSIEDIFRDPHYKARDNIVEVRDRRWGKVKMQDVVPKLSLSPGRVEWAGPPLAGHNLEIYQALLGLSQKEMEELRSSGVI